MPEWACNGLAWSVGLGALFVAVITAHAMLTKNGDEGAAAFVFFCVSLIITGICGGWIFR